MEKVLKVQEVVTEQEKPVEQLAELEGELKQAIQEVKDYLNT
jgi:hypothetical protein